MLRFFYSSHLVPSLLMLVVLGISPELLAADPTLPQFDVVIRNGRIVDGSGNPWFRGDVGIQGARIAWIGKISPNAGKLELDATNLVVAPGFIDIHSHSDNLLLEDGSAQSKVRQGVTTEVFGEGDSAGPSLGKLPASKLTVAGKDLKWRTLGEYFQLIENQGVSVNVASYVGLDSVWQSVMGESFERPSAEQLSQMRTLIRDAMKEGARGMSSMLAMPPGSLTTTEDIVELCREVALAGGIYSSHIRHEGDRVFEAVKEAISIAEKAGLPVDIIHLKIAEQKYWGRMNEIIEIIEAARARGVNVTANVYPYTRGNNDLASIIPPWVHEGGTSPFLERLKNSALRDRIKREIREGLPGWYNHYTAVGGDWSRMLVSKETTYKGLTMDRILAARIEGKSPSPDLLDEMIDYLVQEGGRVGTVYAHHTEEDMTKALAQPWCSIGSDGSSFAVSGSLRRGNPHPRSFGTFPRVLGVYTRELKVLTLEDAIRKMTSLNARKIGLTDRGLLLPGQFADITLFDPQQVIDQSTYTDPFHYPLGIHYVFVNGTMVIEKTQHTGQRPGKVLRKE